MFTDHNDNNPTAPLIVKDHSLPSPIDHYSEDDLSAFGLQGLYRRSCFKLEVKPVDGIIKQLPEKPGEHHLVTAIDASKWHLGSKRVTAVIPVVAACPRLTHLNMKAVGMDSAAAKALVLVLRVHPGIVAFNLSGNHLGLAVGEMILQLVIEHKRVHSAEVSDCLIPAPLLRKIAAHTAANFNIRHQFSIPLIPERHSEEELAAQRIREEQERLRRERAEAESRRIAEQLPPWAPAAIQELRDTLHKHRRNMSAVFAVFKTAHPNAAYVTATNFRRAMHILDVRSFSDVPLTRCAEFADLFCAWDRTRQEEEGGDDMIHFRLIVATLRTHARLLVIPTTGPSLVPAHLQHLADQIFDAGRSLQQSFEMIDEDATGCVPLRSAVIGIAALTGIPASHVEELLLLIVTAGRDEDECSVNYVALLGAIQILPEDDGDTAPPLSYDASRSAIRLLAKHAVPPYENSVQKP